MHTMDLAERWKRYKILEVGHTLAYHRHFTADEFAQIQQGIQPRQMEDKWLIYYEPSSQQLHIGRSWLRQEIYRVEFDVSASGAQVIDTLLSPDMVHDPSDPECNYEIRLLDFLIDRILLHRPAEFPTPPTIRPASKAMDEKTAAVIRHGIAGRA